MFYVFQDMGATQGTTIWPWERKPKIIHGAYATEVHVPAGAVCHRWPRKKAIRQGVREGIKKAVLPKEYEGYGIQPILAKDIYEGLLPQIARAWAKERKNVGIAICFEHITPRLKAGILELASLYRYIKVCCPKEQEITDFLYVTHGMSPAGIPKNVPSVAIICQAYGKPIQTQETIWLEAPKGPLPKGQNFAVGTLKTTADIGRFGLSVTVSEAVIAALYLENNIKNTEITLDIEQMAQYNIVI